MQVREAMAHTISTASPRDDLRTIAQLMRREDAGFIPIVEGDALVGVVTDRDIVIRCLAEGHDDILSVDAAHCMTTDIAAVSPEDDLEAAADLMDRNEVRRLPVVENGALVGILSHGNLVQATHSNGPADRATLGVTRGA